MSIDIEQFLQGSNLRYTKDVNSEGQESFSVPFELDTGPFPVTVSKKTDNLLWISTVLARIDALPASISRKQFYRELLRLNANSFLARASIWTAPEDEEDWVAVEADLPEPSLTSSTVRDAIYGVVFLGQMVNNLIRQSASGGQLVMQQGLEES